MFNAILSVVRSGCTWRRMPKEFPHRLVYYYFAKWQAHGVWQKLDDRLRERVRLQAGKKKPRRLRSSTARALKWLVSAESGASMQAGISADEKASVGRYRGTDFGLCRAPGRTAGPRRREVARTVSAQIRLAETVFVDGGYAGRFLD
jgi:Putative transposase of IS4/5 family (DUF4096)